MKTLVILSAFAGLVLLSRSGYAYTLSFDDYPPGRSFEQPYFNTYYIKLDFSIADHSSSPWGPPHSGSNVAVLGGLITFKGPYGAMYTNSMSAYFSTEMDTVLRIDAYDSVHFNPIATAQIGATGESWNNRYVEVSPPGGSIYRIAFRPVSSYDAALHFSLDDLTVDPVYVPEPSSLVALALGLAPLAAAGMRKKR